MTVHGPDGSGKTSTGRRIVESLIQHHQSAVFFDDWRENMGWVNPFSDKELREQAKDSKEAFLELQMAKVAFDSIAITDLTNLGIIVVKDRGLLDVRADLNYRGIDPAACQGPLIREPDMSIYLQVSEEVRQRRLAVKKDIQPEDFQPNMPGYRMYAMTQFIEAAVRQMGPSRGIIIATDGLSAEQVAEQAYTTVMETTC